MFLHAFDTICMYGKRITSVGSLDQKKVNSTQSKNNVYTFLMNLVTCAHTYSHTMRLNKACLRQSLLFFCASVLLLLFRSQSEAGYALLEMARRSFSLWIPSYGQDVQLVSFIFLVYLLSWCSAVSRFCLCGC